MAKYNQCLIHNQNRFLIKKLQDLINEIMKILCMLLSLRHCQTLIKKIKWHHNTISRTLKNTITKVGIISQISLFSWISVTADFSKGRTKLPCLSIYTSLTIYPLKSLHIYNDLITWCLSTDNFKANYIRGIEEHFQNNKTDIYEYNNNKRFVWQWHLPIQHNDIIKKKKSLR